MRKSLSDIFDEVSSYLRLPNGIDFRVISTETGNPINRRKKVDATFLKKYLRSIKEELRIATFLRDLEIRIGAQIGARLELWLAGSPLDGRRKLSRLQS